MSQNHHMNGGQNPGLNPGNTPLHIQALQQQNLSPMANIIGTITADQLQQVNMLWAQMIQILTTKPQQQLQHQQLFPNTIPPMESFMANMPMMQNGPSVPMMQNGNPDPFKQKVNISNVASAPKQQIKRQTGSNTNSQKPVKPEVQVPVQPPPVQSKKPKQINTANATSKLQSSTFQHQKAPEVSEPSGAASTAAGTSGGTTNNTSPKVRKGIVPKKSQPEQRAPSPPGKKVSSLKGTKNPYLCFKDEVFKTIIANNKNKSQKELMAMVGQQWKALSDTDRLKYQNMSKLSRDNKKKEENGQVKAEVEKKVVAPPAKKVVAKPPNTTDQKKPPFYFYMQIRKSELKQERTLQEQGHPEASDQKLPNTQVEITKHIQSEWKMLTDDQKGRFDIPMETQTELKRRKQTEDVEILRQLVLTQKLPDFVPQQFGSQQPADATAIQANQ